MAQRSVVQRKIGDFTNVIFGLSGRDAKAIQAAVDAGYETFDGADSYGDTIKLLAAAIKKAEERGKKREDFEVIYKVDKTKPDALKEHLEEVAGALGGYLDHVLIHKVTDEEQTKGYEPILAKLKQAKVIKHVGGGDVNAKMEDHLAGKDSFEIDASDLFLGPSAPALVEELNKADKPVFVYNIVATLKKLLGLKPNDKPSPSQVTGMVAMIRARVSTAEPILSSGNEDTIKSNLNVDTPQDNKAVSETCLAIEEATKPKEKDDKPKAVPVGEMEESVGQRLWGFLDKYKWDAEKLFDQDEDYEKACEEKLKLFTSNELAVSYGHKEKEHTLKELIHMLFDKAGNCHRVEAYNFLCGI